MLQLKKKKLAQKSLKIDFGISSLRFKEAGAGVRFDWPFFDNSKLI
jgi:hypothetical protein